MADTAPERWTLEHDGHRMEVECPQRRQGRHIRLYADGEQVAERDAAKSGGKRTGTIAHDGFTVRVTWDRLGHPAIIALVPGAGPNLGELGDVDDPEQLERLAQAARGTGVKDVKDLVTGGEEIWFTPPEGSRAARRERLARRHPRLLAARHVAAAVAKVLLPLPAIALLARIPRPDIDLPELDLPDFDLPDLRPDIDWPDIDLSWLPDIALPGWAQAVLQTAKYWGPVLGAVLIALQEHQRRKRQHDKARDNDRENAGNRAGDRAGRDGRGDGPAKGEQDRSEQDRDEARDRPRVTR
jgi:hypothetical protein